MWFDPAPPSSLQPGDKCPHCPQLKSPKLPDSDPTASKPLESLLCWRLCNSGDNLVLYATNFLRCAFPILVILRIWKVVKSEIKPSEPWRLRPSQRTSPFQWYTKQTPWPSLDPHWHYMVTNKGAIFGRMPFEQPGSPFKILGTASQEMPLKQYDDRRSSSLARYDIGVHHPLHRIWWWIRW